MRWKSHKGYTCVEKILLESIRPANVAFAKGWLQVTCEIKADLRTIKHIPASLGGTAKMML